MLVWIFIEINEWLMLSGWIYTTITIKVSDDVGVNLHLILREPNKVGLDLKPYGGRLERDKT
jgi:hypothetical protein